MKINYKKVATIVGSALMVGATAGMAAAASLPSSFTSDLAIVVGSSAAASDNAAALSITDNLLTGLATSGAVTVTGGDSFKIEKSSDKLNLGDNLYSVLTEGKLDDKDFEAFLADGIYEDDNDVEYDYNQKLYITDKSFSTIVDKDYKNKEPSLGLNYQSGNSVLSYNITYEDELNYSAMPTTDISIAGKNYYVLTASLSQIELLDTALSTTMTEGDSRTIKVGDKEYEVEVVVYNDGAVFTVNGEQTDQLATGDYDKLTDGAYLVAKSVRYSSKESGVSTVEFSIGSGKITLADSAEVKVNTDDVDNFYADIVDDSTSITAINFRWNVEDDTFLTGADGSIEMSMPLFNAVSVVMGGINFPSDTEETELVSSDDYITLETQILEGALSMPILSRTSEATNFTGLGEDADTVLSTNSSSGNSYNISLSEDLESYFVVTYIKGEEGYTYAFELDSVTEVSDEVVVKLSGLTGEADVQFDELNDYVDLDDITLTLVANQSVDNATIQVSTSVSGGAVYSDRIVTAKGLTVMLPTLADINGNTTANPVYNITTWNMTLTEEDKDGDIAAGAAFTATISSADADGVHVSDTNQSTYELVSDDDMYVGYVFSDLATKIEMDESGDTNTFVVRYNGEEVSADVQIVAGGTVSTTTTGVMTVKDTQLASVSGKNLIVIGGSCVNSLSASLLGSACGDSFTSATGVKAGEAIIKSFNYEGKLALLVAGYEALDTTRAATYLSNNGLSAVSGANVKLSTATEATTVLA